MKVVKYLRLLLAVTMLASYQANATTGDTAAATLNVSGNVPAVFSVTARGLPGDLDLTPGSIVIDRLIGLIHFKFNEDAASIKIASSTASGGPEDAANTAYSFGAAFTVKVPATCKSLDLTAAIGTGATLTQAGVDFASTIAKDLTTNVPVGGIEEDCKLTASWHGTTATLPLAGVYSMTITVTMVAN